MTRYFFSIALLSGSIIGYEIVLVRLFSISQWHHFAHMIISLAMLGFGFSGTVISLTQTWLKRHFHTMYTVCGSTYSISVIGCFILHQYIPFNPLMLNWQPTQFLLAGIIYLILSLPFFFGSACIGMVLLQFPDKVGHLYFFDLFGSGISALGSIFMMYIIPPAQNLTLVTAIGFCSVVVTNLDNKRTKNRKAIVYHLTFALLFTIFFLLNPISIVVSPYKRLSSTLNFPDAKIQSTRYSPLGLLQVVKSSSIRAVPGLSLSSQHSIPPQLGMFTDADAMTTITEFDGDLSKLAYLDDTISALAYHLMKEPNVLVVGAGGGTDILNALYHQSNTIDAVEMNPQVVGLIQQEYADFSGQIYAPNSMVQVHIAEIRTFINASTKKYDLIQISMLGSTSASGTGTHTLSENYLYTVEAISDLFQHLAPGGVISITRWLRTPPRDMIRMFAMAVQALETIGNQVPNDQLILVRGWQTATLLIGNRKFDIKDCTTIRHFCHQRSFDTAYYPNMPESEANFYNQLTEPTYFRAAQSILFGDRQQFFQQSPFNIYPATDNRPYFFQSLRLSSLLHMMRTNHRNNLSFIEWEYPLLIATLIQATLAGLGLIFLPLFLWRHRSKTPVDQTHRSPLYLVLFYFLCLGAGFMFVEIAFIQKFLLFLGQPTYTVATVLCGFLVFSGLGSLFSTKFKNSYLLRQRNPILFAIGIVSLITCLYLQLLPFIFSQLTINSDIIKIIFSICLIGPLAFFMGIPFPLGIDLLRRRYPSFIIWAWGINGYTSVISAILATFLAITFGFNTVILLATTIYLFGAWVSCYYWVSE